MSLLTEAKSLASILNMSLFLSQEKVSLSEGSTVDLRKPGEEEDEFSELAEELMDPDDCFPECVYTLQRAV